MKLKILLLSILLSSALCLSASDIIVTRNSEKIEAKITEVSSTEIRYKKANNLEGPTFVIEVSKIATIIYENGDVTAFNAPQQNTQQPAYPQQYQQSGYQGYNQYQGNSYQQQKSGNSRNNRYAQIPPANLNDPNMPYVQKAGHNKYYYGNQLIGSDQYVQLLRERCGLAFTEYRNGSIMAGAGWGALGGGLFVVGMTAWNIWPVAIVGGAFALASVPLLVVGYNKRNKSLDIYNMQCVGGGQPYAVELRFHSSMQGVGLTLTF